MGNTRHGFGKFSKSYSTVCWFKDGFLEDGMRISALYNEALFTSNHLNKNKQHPPVRRTISFDYFYCDCISKTIFYSSARVLHCLTALR